MVEQKYRIGILTPFYPPFIGGAEVVTERVARMLAARGHLVEVHTLRYEQSLPIEVLEGSIKVFRHPFEFIKLFGFTDIHSPSLMQAMKRLEADVVHIHSVTFPYFLAKASSHIKTRDIPSIIITHGIFETVDGGYRGFKGRIYRLLARHALSMLFSKITALGALSSFDVKILKNSHIFHGTYKILLNGVDLQRLNTPSTRSKDRPLKLIHVASLKPNKGHMDVLEALSQSDLNVEYHVIGSGGSLWRAHEEKFKEAITFHNLQEKVICHGRVSDEIKDQLYQESDIVIVPSEAETFPLSVLEGMSYGKPVIATRVGGVEDMIENNIEGLLIDPGKPECIVKAIYELLDPSTRARLGEAAYEKALIKFNWDVVVDRYEELTREIITNRATLSRAHRTPNHI
ncbi:glycosyltransferase family 4 protein [Deinococcus apachensis]|uniref:glycosyltransferase family 4 protein n=1 Tax=Deinococcus apachensis TaxID=309886 RepID=UPI0009FC35A1|nr:glycosyltransferase family 4 protein [Deinococcus apachensis]